MKKLRRIENGWFSFFCPGCQQMHAVPTQPINSDGWTFNGDLAEPSFTPSILVNGNPAFINPAVPRCHLFITKGKIHYCSDCTHPLAGQIVEMKEEY